MPPTAVYCLCCGWSGRRRPGDCACYDEWAMTCSCKWGRCPKCDTQVTTTSPTQARREAAELRAWLDSPDGLECMAELNARFGYEPDPTLAALATES